MSVTDIKYCHFLKLKIKNNVFFSIYKITLAKKIKSIVIIKELM